VIVYAGVAKTQCLWGIWWHF